MSVMMTSTCMFFSKARYSAAVRAMRGVGSLARLVNSTVRSMAPVRRNSWTKNSDSSKVMPMAAKTTAKLDAPAPLSAGRMAASSLWEDAGPSSTLACRAIWAARAAWGRPEPEKIGSFWPRTRVFSPSMVEMPVWINSLG